MSVMAATSDGEPKKRNCAHGRVVLEELGQMSFSGGDIRDTRRLVLFCLDCLQCLDEEPEREDDEELPF